ncbi:uncharacterized protein RHO25_011399 [Cercospora beticola]|uniref:Uncharacterized protein n=1 Tax=Cercospora beticola TaxID=122368 RepID=A0ABZ0P5B7_CERBT|nr:hypothetical protein RHO25_011399 [Cercospora beticola]
MSTTRYLTAVLLAAIVVLAHVTLHKQFEWNGLISPDKIVGCALLVGHALPTVLMVHLKPEGEGIASQQLWTMLRALHPVLVFVVFNAFDLLSGGQSAADQPAERSLLSRRNLLQFSILTSAFVHINCLSMMFGGHIFPGWVRDTALASATSERKGLKQK